MNKRKILILVVLAIVISSLVVAFSDWTGVGKLAGENYISIPKGATISDTAKIAKDAGIVKS
ncbi:hypothetical protein [Treponema sp. R6D11]